MKKATSYLPCLLLLLVIFPNPLFGQYDFIEFLSRENGLPTEKIADWATDPKGNLWLGATQGLYRFDGTAFQHFPLVSTADSVSLRDVYKIAIDSRGKIFCSLLNNGFGVFDPVSLKFKHYLNNPSQPNSLPSNTVDFIVDAENVTFLILESDGFAFFDKSTETFRHFLPSQWVNAKRYPRANDLLTCTRDRNHPERMWITGVEGLFMFDLSLQNLSFFPKDEAPFPFATARCSYIHSDGWLYIGTWGGGVQVFNTLEKHWEKQILTDANKHFDLSSVSAIAEGLDGELWVHSHGRGLFSLQPKNNSCRLRLPMRNKKTPFEQEQYWSLRADVNQVLPLQDGSFAMTGIGMEGMHIYHPNQQFFRKTTTGTVIHKAASAQDGTFYLTTNNPEFWMSQPGGITLKKIPIESSVEYGYRDCFVDKKNQLWIVGSKSLYRFTPGGRSAIPVHFNVIDSLVKQGKWMSSAFLDSKQRLWIGTNRELVVIDDLHRQDYRIRAFSDSLSGSQISWRGFVDFAETEQNRVWFAADRGFGYSDDGGKTFFRYGKDAKKDQPLELADLTSFAIDKLGRLWVGMEGDGLIFLDPRQAHPQVLKVFDGNQPENKISQVKGLESDAGGNIWALTAMGMFKIEPSPLKASFFNRSYGLLASQALTLAKLPENKLMIGALDGFYSFQPETLAADERLPQPTFLSYSYYPSVDEEIVVQAPDEVLLKYPNRSFRVNFGVPWFWASNQVQFQYKLDRYHQQWVNMGNEHQLFLGEIPPGSYSLKLRASNASGGWSDSNIIALPVHIIPAFWQTSWFRLLGIIIVVGLSFWTYFGDKLRRGRQRALNAEYEAQLSRLKLSALRAQMNPHFLFNALNSLKWYIVKGEREKTVDYLDKFSLLMRKALECSKREMIPLSEEVEIISLMLDIERARFQGKFEYLLRVDEKVDVHFFQVPPLLLQPYVENAIWHGLLHKTDGKAMLKFSLEAIPNGFQCVIEDNGIGREKARELKSNTLKNTKSHGMEISQERISLLSKNQYQSVDLVIEDLTDSDGAALGTRVVLTFCP